jgi:hypothetical protein
MSYEQKVAKDPKYEDPDTPPQLSALPRAIGGAVTDPST